MEPVYELVLLDASEASRQILLSRTALGVNLRIPGHAELCRDVVINTEGSIDGRVQPAILTALEMKRLPELGTMLVTDETDLDSVGAIAILNLRAIVARSAFGRSFFDRVNLIATGTFRFWNEVPNI